MIGTFVVLPSQDELREELTSIVGVASAVRITQRVYEEMGNQRACYCSVVGDSSSVMTHCEFMTLAIRQLTVTLSDADAVLAVLQGYGYVWPESQWNRVDALQLQILQSTEALYSESAVESAIDIAAG